MQLLGVIGSDGDIPGNVVEMAEDVGRNIAASGCALVCGGRGGVMAAACRGAKSVGGLTIGILSGVDKSDANEFVDVAMPTGLGYARNVLVVLSPDAVIAIAGSTGTLSEISMALNYGKPVVVVEGSGGVCDKLRDAFSGDERFEKIVYAPADNAVEEAIKLIGPP